MTNKIEDAPADQALQVTNEKKNTKPANLRRKLFECQTQEEPEKKLKATSSKHKQESVHDEPVLVSGAKKSARKLSKAARDALVDPLENEFEQEVPTVPPPVEYDSLRKNTRRFSGPPEKKEVPSNEVSVIVLMQAP